MSKTHYLPDASLMPVGHELIIAGRKFRCMESHIYTDDGQIYMKRWQEVENKNDNQSN